VEMELNRIENI